MAPDRDVPFDRYWTRRLSDRSVREAILHPRRRYALYYLRERSAPVEIDELADQIAVWESEGEESERARAGEGASEKARADERESVAASLRRRHVPYLAERGIVTYDSDRDRVAYDTDDSTLAMCLANDYRTSIAWHRVYLALTAVSVVLLALVWLDAGPLAGVPAIAVAGVVVVLFAVTSAIHWYDVYRWRRENDGEPPDFLVSLGGDVVERPPEEEPEEEPDEERWEEEREEE